MKKFRLGVYVVFTFYPFFELTRLIVLDGLTPETTFELGYMWFFWVVGAWLLTNVL